MLTKDRQGQAEREKEQAGSSQAAPGTAANLRFLDPASAVASPYQPSAQYQPIQWRCPACLQLVQVLGGADVVCGQCGRVVARVYPMKDWAARGGQPPVVKRSL